MKRILLAILIILSPETSYAAFLRGGTTAPVAAFVLDQVPCAATTDAAYGTVKLSSTYAGNAIQMRVKQSGSYVTQNIGFIGNVIDSASADTFAATADSGTPPELRFYDQCGNGNDTAFNGSVKGAFWSPYTLDNTGLRSASFDTLYDNSTLSTRQVLLLPTAMAMNMDAFSAVFIGRRGTAYPAHNDAYWQFANTSPWNAVWYDWVTDSGNSVLESSGTKLNYGTVETTSGVYMNVIGSTTSVLDANEVSTSKTKSTLSTIANNGGYIGSSAALDGLYDGGQDVIAQVFYNRTLNSTEQANIDTIGYGLVGAVNNVPTCVVTMGDSLTQGYVAPYNTNYINQAINGVATTINKSVRVYATPTNGTTSAVINSNISRYTGACSNASVTKKIALVMAGTNDLAMGTTPSNTATLLYSIWTAMHNAGFKVVCATIPNNVGTPSTIGPLNTIISANYAANNCDALADVWANPNIGNGSNTSNLTYFYQDGTHLTTIGYGIIGQLFATQINTLD